MLDNVRSIWHKPIDTWEEMTESLTHFSAYSKLDSLVESDVDSLSKFLDSFRNNRDKFTLKVFYDIDESIEFSNCTSREKIDEKLEDLRQEIVNLETDEYLSISIDIAKKLFERKDRILVDNIYSIEILSIYLNRLTLTQLHSVISKRYGGDRIEGVILVGDYRTSLHTNYFHFIPKDEFRTEQFQHKSIPLRIYDIHRLRDSLGHFANASDWFLLPEHFKLPITLSYEFTLIASLFNALHNAYT